MKQRVLTRVVIILSLVSLFNDISSEMLYPIMPLFLQSIGFNALWIGLLEGTAQVAIGFSTGYFGQLSDQMGKRMPFISIGYFMSTFAKPLMAFSKSSGWIFFARVSERLGKGVRVSARDAFLADESTAGRKGTVFGFHRAMDTLGAAIGPCIALWYLYYHPGDYRSLFLVAFIPGIIAAVMTLMIREKGLARKENKDGKSFFSYLNYWKRASRNYRLITAGLLVFALMNSADAFLFLMSKQAGLSERDLIMAYVVYNLVYAVFAMPAGYFADQFGMRNMFVTGLIFFAITYGGFSMLNSVSMLFILFIVYGLFGACTEGISKAWLSKHCAPDDKGTALGFYRSISSLFALFASALSGWLWLAISPAFSLAFSAGATVVIIMFFLVFLPGKDPDSSIKEVV